MTPPLQVKKVGNEGSSSPFISRIFFGLLELRNQLFLISFDGEKKQSMMGHFDKQFKPLYDAVQASRDAALKIIELLSNHQDNIQSGGVVNFRVNQYDSNLILRRD